MKGELEIIRLGGEVIILGKSEGHKFNYAPHRDPIFYIEYNEYDPTKRVLSKAFNSLDEIPEAQLDFCTKIVKKYNDIQKLKK